MHQRRGHFLRSRRRDLHAALLSGDIDLVPLPGYQRYGIGNQSADGIVAPAGMLA
jgi:hypothetical protein